MRNSIVSSALLVVLAIFIASIKYEPSIHEYSIDGHSIQCWRFDSEHIKCRNSGQESASLEFMTSNPKPLTIKPFSDELVKVEHNYYKVTVSKQVNLFLTPLVTYLDLQFSVCPDEETDSWTVEFAIKSEKNKGKVHVQLNYDSGSQVSFTLDSAGKSSHSLPYVKNMKWNFVNDDRNGHKSQYTEQGFEPVPSGPVIFSMTSILETLRNNPLVKTTLEENVNMLLTGFFRAGKSSYTNALHSIMEGAFIHDFAASCNTRNHCTKTPKTYPIDKLHVNIIDLYGLQNSNPEIDKEIYIKVLKRFAKGQSFEKDKTFEETKACIQSREEDYCFPKRQNPAAGILFFIEFQENPSNQDKIYLKEMYREFMDLNIPIRILVTYNNIPIKELGCNNWQTNYIAKMIKKNYGGLIPTDNLHFIPLVNRHEDFRDLTPLSKGAFLTPIYEILRTHLSKKNINLDINLKPPSSRCSFWSLRSCF